MVDFLKKSQPQALHMHTLTVLAYDLNMYTLNLCDH